MNDLQHFGGAWELSADTVRTDNFYFVNDLGDITDAEAIWLASEWEWNDYYAERGTEEGND